LKRWLFGAGIKRNERTTHLDSGDLEWEINFGVGYDVSNPSDRLIVKFILGRRFRWGGDREHEKPSNNTFQTNP
jgi:hypothetical protein